MALASWEASAQLVGLREHCLARLERLQKGEWLQPGECFTAAQEAALRRQGAWVVRPNPSLVPGGTGTGGGSGGGGGGSGGSGGSGSGEPREAAASTVAVGSPVPARGGAGRELAALKVR